MNASFWYATLAALSLMVCLVCQRTIPRLRAVGALTAHGCSPEQPLREASATLLLAMLATAIEQGSSIPRSIEALGCIVSGRLGNRLCAISSRLMNGVSWKQAWGSPEPKKSDDVVLSWLSDALRAAWERGDSPVSGLQSAIEQLDIQQRAKIERTCARLSVQLLMPMALCFLPAFICIGVLPSIISFIR